MLSKSENMSEETVNVTEQRKYIFVVSYVEWAVYSKKKDIFPLLSVCHMSLFDFL